MDEKTFAILCENKDVDIVLKVAGKYMVESNKIEWHRLSAIEILTRQLPLSIPCANKVTAVELSGIDEELFDEICKDAEIRHLVKITLYCGY